jgi:hypothetical protein
MEDRVGAIALETGRGHLWLDGVLEGSIEIEHALGIRLKIGLLSDAHHYETRLPAVGIFH